MKLWIAFLFLSLSLQAQTNSYTISFDNAVHHEAIVKATFPEVKSKTLRVQMSRSSPGRYAIHEFAKNVYGFKATNGAGEPLEVKRDDPYSWIITNTDGTINVEYILFANRGGGTYSQVDLTHAHLNIPATFMYAETLQERPIEITFDARKDLNWKVATQLKHKEDNTFSAPNLYYFMDSPTEISDYQEREFQVDGQTVKFVLHDPNPDSDFDTYWERIQAIVLQEKAVFGELPTYDFGEYTFLACYAPNVSGDGMEHRNSTILTDTETLAEGGMEWNIGTVSHEFFHSWNVERIRPADLEPFQFDQANMSNSLWFAEGFTSYYTNLILERAGVISAEDYVKGLNGTFNYVWNSPALQYFNPIEMSNQAPFVDAATSVDPVNRENMFISYYSYGSVLGLALDLSLREKDLNLDDFMQLMWKRFGKTEVAYTVENIEATLADYAGAEFAQDFFGKYIYKSNMPDYKNLFEQVGLQLNRATAKPYFGASFSETSNGLEISRNTFKGSPAYQADLDKGDLITSIDGIAMTSNDAFKELLSNKNIDDVLQVTFERFGEEHKTKVRLTADPTFTIAIDNNAKKEAVKAREAWLAKK
ncbi:MULTISPECIES: M61 family metallopeptidase [Leeuwenhoekiella]|jgi:predicted metalloprotease with PDZ domain|uniref:M61 family metallopeptidase n=1 Tax=Leeuwenhoekiella TaxID=283735 RepID=UPI000C3CB86C|nr:MULTISPECIES: PDZ domain-containing protein [Leeuwenhoekiella]MAO43947.1 peptidase M61 [Leeuwenhoekiella sp.]MBQ51466.1 peptidase M61 [Leeuwenhoekiella sp.]HCW63271.1 peptidase M61 [Leeuwenhoekiella sp.]|tara:strand:- start:198925 stop:200697 length:1773 start_codon:yes stop_codon:yes gene_type:complete